MRPDTLSHLESKNIALCLRRALFDIDVFISHQTDDKLAEQYIDISEIMSKDKELHNVSVWESLQRQQMMELGWVCWWYMPQHQLTLEGISDPGLVQVTTPLLTGTVIFQ